MIGGKVFKDRVSLSQASRSIHKMLGRRKPQRKGKLESEGSSDKSARLALAQPLWGLDLVSLSEQRGSILRGKWSGAALWPWLCKRHSSYSSRSLAGKGKKMCTIPKWNPQQKWVQDKNGRVVVILQLLLAWLWWCTAVIPILKKLRPKDHRSQRWGLLGLHSKILPKEKKINGGGSRKEVGEWNKTSNQKKTILHFDTMMWLTCYRN